MEAAGLEVLENRGQSRGQDTAGSRGAAAKNQVTPSLTPQMLQFCVTSKDLNLAVAAGQGKD